MKIRRYLYRNLQALDQIINTVFNGWPDETISARFYRRDMQGKPSWPRRGVDRLFFVVFGERGHCYRAWQNEVDRRHMPTGYRTGGRP